MNYTSYPLLLSCLLATASAQAALPQPPAAQPPREAQPTSACALALHNDAQTPPAQPAAPPPAKVNMDFLYDPCQLSDTEKDSDIANNEGEPPKDDYAPAEDWVEWNRMQADNNGVALLLPFSNTYGVPGADGQAGNADAWWQRQPDDVLAMRQQALRWHQPDSAGAAPAVPEPATVFLWLAGLPLLALAAWRRRVPLSCGTAPPAARR